MTDCNHDPLAFSSLGPKAVVADFPGGQLTTDAGALLLREVADRTRTCSRPSTRHPRPPPPRLHHPRPADHARPADHRHRPGLRGPQRPPDPARRPRPPDRRRTAARAGRRHARLAAHPLPAGEPRRSPALVRIAEVLVDQFIASHPHAARAPDPRLRRHRRPVHGKQEGRFFHGYYDHHCFLPLYVFCGDELLAAYLRPSNIDAAKHARPS